MKRVCNNRLAKAAKEKAFDIIKERFYNSILPFCDFSGRCWIVVGDIKKPISSEEYHSLKEAGL